MNYKFVFKLLGRILIILAGSMVAPLIVSAYYQEPIKPFLISIILMLASGVALDNIPASRSFYVREGIFSVGLIWLFTCLAGALPFFFSGYFPSLIDCIFESVSGFSTTGATILTNIEALPNGILFWRALTHWLGGMGVLVLATAIAPTLGIRSHYLTRAESTGPVTSKLVPKQAQTSKILYGIYCLLTLLEVLCLRIAGMPFYDSLIHAFSTAGTGGFSNRNASVGAYNNPAAEIIISIFLLLFSMNFAAHFYLMTRRFRQAFKNDEIQFFFCVIAVMTLAIFSQVQPNYSDNWMALRHSFFTVCSIISTTGFAVADYCDWTMFAQIIMLFLMLCGGCSGSTSGGLKCSRVLLVWRCIKRELYCAIHPRSVQVVKLDGKVVEESTLHTTLAFLCCIVLLIVSGTMLISLDGFSFATTFSAVLTCISNAGPGLDMVSPSGNFSEFSVFSKLVFSMLMVTGRLEIFPVLILFSPSTWRRI